MSVYHVDGAGRPFLSWHPAPYSTVYIVVLNSRSPSSVNFVGSSGDEACIITQQKSHHRRDLHRVCLTVQSLLFCHHRALSMAIFHPYDQGSSDDTYSVVSVSIFPVERDIPGATELTLIL